MTDASNTALDDEDQGPRRGWAMLAAIALIAGAVTIVALVLGGAGGDAYATGSGDVAKAKTSESAEPTGDAAQTTQPAPSDPAADPSADPNADPNAAQGQPTPADPGSQDAPDQATGDPGAGQQGSADSGSGGGSTGGSGGGSTGGSGGGSTGGGSGSGGSTNGYGGSGGGSGGGSQPQPTTQAPAPEPTCKSWYWMGVALYNGQLMNKYNVEGSIVYLPLTSPHALTKCW